MSLINILNFPGKKKGVGGEGPGAGGGKGKKKKKKEAESLEIVPLLVEVKVSTNKSIKLLFSIHPSPLVYSNRTKSIHYN